MSNLCILIFLNIFVKSVKGKSLRSSNRQAINEERSAGNEADNNLLFEELKKLHNLKECSIVLKRLDLKMI